MDEQITGDSGGNTAAGVHAPRDDDAAGCDASSVLRALEGDVSETEFLFQRARSFKRAAELHRGEGNESAARRYELLAVLFDFHLLSRRERTPGRGRFQPQWEMGGRAYPHLEAVTDEALDVFQDELAHTQNPIHRSLLADILWEKRRDHRAAREAVDAYLASADQYRANGWDDQTVDALDRASDLALQLRDPALIQRAKEASLRLARELIEARTHPEVRWALDALETLQGFGKRLSANEHEVLVSLIEEGAAFYLADGDLPLERSFLELLPISLRALRRPVDAGAARRRVAASFEAQAVAGDSQLAAMHFFEQALSSYAACGDRAKVDEIKQRLSEAGKGALSEMVTISVEAVVPKGSR